MLYTMFVGIFSGYYWTAFDVVEYHTKCHPMDRPLYVRGPLYQKIIAGMLWPRATLLNREFGWCLCWCTANTFVATILYSIATRYLNFIYCTHPTVSHS